MAACPFKSPSLGSTKLLQPLSVQKVLYSWKWDGL